MRRFKFITKATVGEYTHPTLEIAAITAMPEYSSTR